MRQCWRAALAVVAVWAATCDQTAAGAEPHAPNSNHTPVPRVQAATKHRYRTQQCARRFACHPRVGGAPQALFCPKAHRLATFVSTVQQSTSRPRSTNCRPGVQQIRQACQKPLDPRRRTRAVCCCHAQSSAPHAVTRQAYVDWVRKEVWPLEYDKETDVYQHNWPPRADDAPGAATDGVSPSDVVVMTQTSPDRCAPQPVHC